MVTDQYGSLQHQFWLYLFATKSICMDRVGCGEDDRGNNNKQKEFISWIYYTLWCGCAHCNDWQDLDFTIHN